MLGTNTDRFVQPADTRFLERDAYTVILTPSCPDYYSGNYLMLRQPPRADALGPWVEAWRQEFAAAPEVRAMILQWESAASMPPWGHGATRFEVAGLSAPLELSNTVVMALDTLVPPAGAPPAEARPATSDEDWHQILELTLEDVAPDDGARVRFHQFRLREYRALAEQGSGAWWMSVHDRELWGSAGFFVCGDLARFQEVMTRAAARRRGVCTHLVHAMLDHHLSRAPGATIVIVAEPGSTAESIYRRLGFREVSRLWTLQGRRP